MLNELDKLLEKKENQKKAIIMQRFFKTGKGEYGEGDIFLGITVPEQRKIAKEFLNLHYVDLQSLLESKIHEKRLISLLILVEKYKKADNKNKSDIVKFYLQNAKNINNWDLVDLSASKILGEYLLDKNRNILYKLAKSNNIWERRISIISTYAFIKNNEYDDTLKISKILLRDRHDLIQKAVGWMLREMGKKNIKLLESFLKKHIKNISRTSLRYSIEKMSENKRKYYLKLEK